MKVGICGIGDIAQKGYLPILTQREKVELFVCTRNEDTLKKVMRQYHLTQGSTSMSDLVEWKPDAVFITSTTLAHVEMAKSFLSKGIPVHIDKPISMDYAQSKELTDLAQQKNILFTVGFNRRYVPLVKEVHDKGIPDLVIYQKNRHLQADPVRRFIVEDFIHVVDTTRYLLQSPILNVQVFPKLEEDLLVHVVVHVQTAVNQAVCVMNYHNGITEEVIEVMHDHEKNIIRNLAHVDHYHENSLTQTMGSDWTPTLRKRGFEAMIEAFLESIQTHSSKVISAQDALETHLWCEKIVEAIEATKNEA